MSSCITHSHWGRSSAARMTLARDTTRTVLGRRSRALAWRFRSPPCTPRRSHHDRCRWRTNTDKIPHPRQVRAACAPLPRRGRIWSWIVDRDGVGVAGAVKRALLRQFAAPNAHDEIAHIGLPESGDHWLRHVEQDTPVRQRQASPAASLPPFSARPLVRSAPWLG